MVSSVPRRAWRNGPRRRSAAGRREARTQGAPILERIGATEDDCIATIRRSFGGTEPVSPGPPRAAFSSSLAEELAPDVLDRFLRYVRIDTQGAYRAAERPSTEKQLDLVAPARRRAASHRSGRRGADRGAQRLRHASRQRGRPGRRSDRARRHDARTSRRPASRRSCTRSTAGEPIVLPGDPHQVLDPAVLPALAARVGHDIVTSDGTTLLGADDKAGVAEIMAAVAYLTTAGGERPRATIRVAFTVDEEVGRGAQHFDLDAFGADGRLHPRRLRRSASSRSRRSRRLQVTGRDPRARRCIPGSAKGKLVNAVKLAADLVTSLPADSLSPETTEGREGYVHPSRISARPRRPSSTSSPATTTTSSWRSTSSCCGELAESGRGARAPGARHRRGTRLVPQHAAVIEQTPAGRRGGARGDPPRRRRAGAAPIIRGGTDGAVL